MHIRLYAVHMLYIKKNVVSKEVEVTFVNPRSDPSVIFCYFFN